MRWWYAVVGFVVACGEGGPPRGTAPSPAESSAAPIVTMGPPVPTVSLVARDHRGGAMVVAGWEKRDVLIIADRERRALRVVDPATLRELAHQRLDGTPSQVLVVGGKVVVALRDRNRIETWEATVASTFEARESAVTAAEPVALASTPDGATVLVSSAWGRRLASFDDELRPRWSVPLPREPRSVTVAPDGTRAFVTHAVGSLVSEVVLQTGGEPTTRARSLAGTDLPPPEPMFELQFNHHVPRLDRHDDPATAAEQITRPAVFRRESPTTDVPAAEKGLDEKGLAENAEAPGEGRRITRHWGQAFASIITDDELFVPGVLAHPEPTRGGSYGSGAGLPGHEPAVAVLHHHDVASTLRADSQAFESGALRAHNGAPPAPHRCFLPRDIALHAASNTLLVACEGSDQVVAHRANRAPLSLSTPARWRVPAGPVAVVVHPAREEAFVWSAHDRRISRLDLAVLAQPYDPQGPRPLPQTVTGASLPPLDDGPQVSASVRRGHRLFHRSGDARISGGGRACASCHPDGRDDGLTWSTPQGRRQTPMLAGRLDRATAPYGWEGASATVAEHLGETFRRLGGRGLAGEELADLVAYCESMPTPTRPTDESAEVARGRQLFHAAETGCAMCHTEGGGSDGLRHEVGGGATVETPSLRFVAGTGPYFHDGRFATLEDMLEATAGTMGFAADLGAPDRTALAAYLRTL